MTGRDWPTRDLARIVCRFGVAVNKICAGGQAVLFWSAKPPGSGSLVSGAARLRLEPGTWAIFEKGQSLDGAQGGEDELRPSGSLVSGAARLRLEPGNWSKPSGLGRYTRKATRWVAFLVYGPPQRIRTSDLRLRRATLYPAELGADGIWLVASADADYTEGPGVGKAAIWDFRGGALRSGRYNDYNAPLVEVRGPYGHGPGVRAGSLRAA